jgi:hypothetical protein
MKLLKWLWSYFGGPPAAAPDLIVKVQAETVKLCGFLPAATTVGTIISAMTGQGLAVATALNVATTICRAVTSLKVQGLVGEIKPVVDVNGVVIEVEGEFVK